MNIEKIYFVYYALIMAMLALIPLPSHAGYALVAHTVSYHDKRDFGLNERNPGIGVRYSLDDIDIQIGRYKNSYKVQSNYALIDYFRYNLGSFKLGGFAAIATGYDCQGYKYAAGPGLVGRYAYNPFDVTVRFIPRDKAKNSNVTSLEFSYSF